MSFFKRFSKNNSKSYKSTAGEQKDVDQRQYFLFYDWHFTSMNKFGQKCHSFYGSEVGGAYDLISVFVESVIKSYIRKNKKNERLLRTTIERIVDEQVYESEITQTNNINTLPINSKEFENTLEHLIQNLISSIDKYVRLQKKYNFNSPDFSFSIILDTLEPIHPYPQSQRSSIERKKSEKRRQTT